MAPLTNDTRCPHCGSREFWPARSRGLERLLGDVLPYVPYRCRACLRRYVVLQPWVLRVRLYAGAIVVCAALVVLVHGLFFSGGGSHDEATVPAVEQTASAPAVKSADNVGPDARNASSASLQTPSEGLAESSVPTTTDGMGNESISPQASVPTSAPLQEDALRPGVDKDAISPSVQDELATMVQQVPDMDRKTTVSGGVVEGPLSFSFYADVPKGGAANATQ